MSGIKAYIEDSALKSSRDIETAFSDNGFALSKSLDLMINDKIDKSKLLYKFLNVMLPDAGGYYYAFIHDPSQKFDDSKRDLFCNKNFQAKEDYITALVSWADYPKHNLYLSTCSYSKKSKKDIYVNKNRTCVVDIDDIDVSGIKTKDDIVNFLNTNYKVTEEYLPNYVSLSGHGMHLWFILTDSDCYDHRKQLATMLFAYFSADPHSIPASHYFRVPESFNCKKITEPIKTKLFEIHDSPFDIDFLEKYYYMSEDDIIKAKDKYYEKVHKNFKNCGRKKAKKENQEKEEKSPKVWSYEGELPDMTEMHYAKNFDLKRPFHNVLLDLHNYFIRHGGQIKRNNFFMCLSVVCFMSHFSLYEALNYCSRYVASDFEDEMQDIVTYEYEKEYRFYLKNIAYFLEFTEEDYNNSYSGFSEKRRKELRQARNRRYYEACKEKRGLSKLQQKRLDIFDAYSLGYTTKEVADLFLISIRTAQRYRKEYINSVALELSEEKSNLVTISKTQEPVSTEVVETKEVPAENDNAPELESHQVQNNDMTNLKSDFTLEEFDEEDLYEMFDE